MWESYKVAVKLSLVNHVSTGLLAMSKQFRGLHGDAKQLEERLAKIRTLGLAGGATAAAGFAGLALIGKAIKPAEEYAHQLNVMQMAGMNHKQMVEAIGDAWANTGRIITSTATGNLKALLDLRNILGNMREAHAALPVVTKMQAVLAASKEGRISGNSQDLAFSAAKAIDMLGMAQNRKDFDSYANSITRVIEWSQGRILPKDYQQAFKYARQAKFGWSQDFIQNYLPSLMLEYKGSGGMGQNGGVGPMFAAMYRITNQGYINRASLPLLAKLGLVNAGTALHTTTTGTTVGAMTGASLAASNPFQWVQQILLPAIYKHYGHSLNREQLINVINQMFRGNQLGAAIIAEMAVKPKNILRDAAKIQGTVSMGAAYRAALSNDPNTARAALHSQWENFKTAATMSLVPVMIPLLYKLTHGLQHLAMWMRHNQEAVKVLVGGFTALSAALAVGGTVLAATAAFKGLGLALTILQPSALAATAGALKGVALNLSVLGRVAGAAWVGWEVGKGINWLASKGIQWVSHGKVSNIGDALYDMTHKAYDPNAHNLTVQIDGEDVRHRILKHSHPRPATGAQSLNSLLAPLSPGLNTVPGL